MPPRCLLVPVAPDFPSSPEYPWLQTFSTTQLHQVSSWAELLAGAEPPEVLVLNLAYQVLPPWLWESDLPRLALAPDAPLQWHSYRSLLPRCVHLLADVPTVGRLHQHGFPHVHAANLFGACPALLEQPLVHEPRPIDLLFVGNLHPAVTRFRLPWLQRLARLRERYQVVLATGVHGNDYHTLLQRARIVFNLAARSECNLRAFEACASGALLFQEASNQEVPRYLQPGVHYIPYDHDNLETLLEHYLHHEDQRRTLVTAAHAHVQPYGRLPLLSQALEAVTADLPTLQERARRLTSPDPIDELLARTWTASSATSRDLSLVDDLRQAVREHPQHAGLHNALGVALALHAPTPLRGDEGRFSAAAFEEALRWDPDHVVAGVNRVQALVGLGEDRAACAQARAVLAALDQRTPSAAVLAAPLFPPGYDFLRVEWEQAAWHHPGALQAECNAKVQLLRWRLHTTLASLTDSLLHAYEAVLARPDLPTSQAELGCALGRAGQPHLAATHLRLAVAANPFDAAAARACFQALSEAGAVQPARQLARDRRLLLEASHPKLVPPEAWFLDAPPTGAELTSIVIVCCNALDYTRACVASVLRHSRPPYELIVVDNGSHDETPAFLEQLRQQPGPSRLVVLRNDSNRGYAAGVNQGLAHCRGRFLVLLNNDCVVTPGWLEGLIAWSLQRWPRVGLVGPRSNGAPAPQFLQPDYTSLEDLDAFAQRWGASQRGQGLTTARLTGFCLLLRREVVQQVGGLDEQFGLGFFEDDDLGLRAQEAGFELVVAHDVYVHHHGQATFRALALDAQRLLEDNFRRFQTKWGTEKTRGYRLPTGALPAATAPRPDPFADRTGKTTSLCLIVRNEEANLPACLEPVRHLFDQIVVVDTGSSDRTRAVAEALGAEVYDFPWCDSFAAARNESLRHARGDWIFWLDADDRIEGDHVSKLEQLLATLGNDNRAYALKCRCPEDSRAAETVVDHIRLFRNHPQMRWVYRVHEQILPAIKTLGGEVHWSDVVITHVGYQDPALRQRKLQRDLRLLQLDLEEHPEEPFLLFNLASIACEQGQHTQAIAYARRSLSRSHPDDSIVRKLYAQLGGSQAALGQVQEALAAYAAGLQRYPDDAELLYRHGSLLLDSGNYPAAEAALLRLLSGGEKSHFASVDPGLRGSKGRRQLAQVYQRGGKWDEARRQWRQLLQDQPGSLAAWWGLGEAALARRDQAELEEAAQALEQSPEGALDAGVLRVRWHLGQGETGPARARLQAMLEHSPRVLALRQLWADAWLQEGNDEEAEQALRQVLLLDPCQPRTQLVLSDLLRRRLLSETKVFEALEGIQEWLLHQHYQTACTTPSDIHEHLPTLQALARECRHITAMGTRTGVSTLALLAGRPRKLVCYDQVRCPEVERLQALAGPTEFIFHQADVLQVEIEATDLLLIATLHTYDQLRAELARHAGKVRHYLVLHNTTPFGDQGAQAGSRGLWPAVEELLATGLFRVRARYQNNHGLTILERQEIPQPQGLVSGA